MADVNEQAVAELQREAGNAVTWATGLTVATAEDANMVMTRLGEMKGVRARWVAYWGPLKKAANETWKGIVAKEKAGTDIVDLAESIAKAKVLAWQQAERAKAEAEQRRLQAEADERARKERERAEAAARLQREKEAAAQREADEARRKAAEATNAAERDRLQREAEKRQAAANGAAAKAALKDDQAAAVVAPVVTVTAAAATASGTATRKTYKAVLVDKAALVASAATNPTAASLLTFNQATADAFARATKGAVAVPGVRFEAADSLSVRSR